MKLSRKARKIKGFAAFSLFHCIMIASFILILYDSLL
nr:MAG TPA: hypothetical protein [Caudoviricetes sp.]